MPQVTIIDIIKSEGFICHEEKSNRYHLSILISTQQKLKKIFLLHLRGSQDSRKIFMDNGAGITKRTISLQLREPRVFKCGQKVLRTMSQYNYCSQRSERLAGVTRTPGTHHSLEQQ